MDLPQVVFGTSGGSGFLDLLGQVDPQTLVFPKGVVALHLLQHPPIPGLQPQGGSQNVDQEFTVGEV